MIRQEKFQVSIPNDWKVVWDRFVKIVEKDKDFIEQCENSAKYDRRLRGSMALKVRYAIEWFVKNSQSS